MLEINKLNISQLFLAISFLTACGMIILSWFYGWGVFFIGSCLLCSSIAYRSWHYDRFKKIIKFLEQEQEQ